MITQTIRELMPLSLQAITYVGEFPTDVDECVALTEVGGPFGTYFNQDKLNTPHLKVAVRAPKYDRAYQLIQLCKEMLTSYADAKTLGIVLIGDIMYLGRDDKRRNHFQLTFKIFY